MIWGVHMFMCVYTCVHIWMYACMYIHMSIYIYIHELLLLVCADMHIVNRSILWSCVGVYIFVCEHVCVHMYLYVYICIYIYNRSIYIDMHELLQLVRADMHSVTRSILHMCRCIHVYVQIYMFIYVCIYVYIYISTYIKFINYCCVFVQTRMA